MTTRTAQMTARTESMTLGALTRSTLAARSLAAVDRIVDTEQRRVAFARHMTDFPPLIANY